jgi:hypothetical protein
MIDNFENAKLLKSNEQTKSFCDTLEFLSPEEIDGTGHNYMVDWW